MVTKMKVTVFSTLALAIVGIIVAAYAGLAGTGTASAAPTDNMLGSSSVYRFADASQVDGASATLSRTKNGITGVLSTSDLDAGNAYTMWWVIFNNPENCVAPAPGLSNCGEADVFGMPLGQTPVDVSVQFAGGNIVGDTTEGDFGAYLAEGGIPGGDGQMVFGSGLKDSKKAEVHLVVRNHGPIIAELEQSQINTFGGACTAETDPTGVGPVGPNECFDEQFAIFLPANDK